MLLLCTRLNPLPQRKQKFRNGKAVGGATHPAWGKNWDRTKWPVLEPEVCPAMRG